MNELSKRKRIRLHDFDYSQSSYYYATICTYGKEHLFGMGKQLSAYGVSAETCLLMIPQIFSGVYVDKYVIMPNHIHAIIVIENDAAEL